MKISCTSPSLVGPKMSDTAVILSSVNTILQQKSLVPVKFSDEIFRFLPCIYCKPYKLTD